MAGSDLLRQGVRRQAYNAVTPRTPTMQDRVRGWDPSLSFARDPQRYGPPRPANALDVYLASLPRPQRGSYGQQLKQEALAFDPRTNEGLLNWASLFFPGSGKFSRPEHLKFVRDQMNRSFADKRGGVWDAERVLYPNEQQQFTNEIYRGEVGGWAARDWQLKDYFAGRAEPGTKRMPPSFELGSRAGKFPDIGYSTKMGKGFIQRRITNQLQAAALREIVLREYLQQLGMGKGIG